ncbi:hypothetical protein E1A91_A01G145000v1 [Gossypium mustelinum]|uniref:Uncharacterized protein n=1 Tax=Gossypium mustelinum TaxID=34275 RepID=A0A5D3AFS3_GOSMU|nr:hypothetical protein E1A91_A01G145000v1 [Gossypium mustelinum]
MSVSFVLVLYPSSKDPMTTCGDFVRILARQLSDSGFLEVKVSHTIKAPFWYNFG